MWWSDRAKRWFGMPLGPLVFIEYLFHVFQCLTQVLLGLRHFFVLLKCRLLHSLPLNIITISRPPKCIKVKDYGGHSIIILLQHVYSIAQGRPRIRKRVLLGVSA